MSKPKIKRRKLPTMKRALQWTQQHLQDTSLLTDFVSPQWTPEEEAEARYLASAITQQFTAKPDKVKSLGQKAADEVSARMRHLTIVRMYQMLVGGTIQFYTNVIARPKGPVDQTPIDAPITPEEQARIKATFKAEGLKFETNGENNGHEEVSGTEDQGTVSSGPADSEGPSDTLDVQAEGASS